MDIRRQPFLLNCLHYNYRVWWPNSKNPNWKNCDNYLCTYRFSSNGYLFKKQWDSNGKLFSIYLLEMLQMLLWYFNFSKAYIRIFWIVDRNFYLYALSFYRFQNVLGWSNFFVPDQKSIYICIVAVTNILCQTKRWFAFSKIVFCPGTKGFEPAQKFDCI